MNLQARWIVAIATATALMAAVWLSKAEGGGVVAYVAYAALIAGPLLARDTKSFQQVCRIGALVLVVVGLVGLFFGLFWFWPSAVLLILASHAVRAPRRQARRLATISAVIGIVVAAAWGAAIYRTALRPADAYVVMFDSAKSAQSAVASGAGDASRVGFGATRVNRDRRRWRVRFRSGLPAGERAQLVTRLTGLPGVVQVRLCSRWNGEC